MRFTCTFTVNDKDFVASEGDEVSRILDRLMDTLCGTEEPPAFGLDVKTPIRDSDGLYIGYWVLEADGSRDKTLNGMAEAIEAARLASLTTAL